MGHEKTLTAMIPALAGANMIYGLGMLESGITFDYGQLLLDCEFARMIKFTIQGIPVSDETLAVDVIKEIGPGSDFLMHNHTFDGMRKQSKPELIDRKMRLSWDHQPTPMPDGVLATIRSIVVEAEKELGIT